jgi:2,3,4,5-tetrahydropyridine-2-carboxylate N-succinyltransferase
VTAASGVGLATIAADGTVLDTWFPAPELAGSGEPGTVRLTGDDIPADFAGLTGPDVDRGVEVVAVRTTIANLADKPADTHDAYLRLHLLSHRLTKPARGEPGRHLRSARQRGVDQLRAVRGGGLRDRAGAIARAVR